MPCLNCYVWSLFHSVCESIDEGAAPVHVNAAPFILTCHDE